MNQVSDEKLITKLEATRYRTGAIDMGLKIQKHQDESSLNKSEKYPSLLRSVTMTRLTREEIERMKSKKKPTQSETTELSLVLVK